jgi:hypothetical protein
MPTKQLGADEATIQSVFEFIDKQQDGVLSRIEVIQACRRNKSIADVLGIPHVIKQEDGSRDLFEKVFQCIDSESDSEISYESFKQYWRRRSSSGEIEPCVVPVLPELLFPAGLRVVLQGLQSVQLDGTTGVVHSWDAVNGKYNVLLDAPERGVAVSPAYVGVVCESAAAERYVQSRSAAMEARAAAEAQAREASAMTTEVTKSAATAQEYAAWARQAVEERRVLGTLAAAKIALAAQEEASAAATTAAKEREKAELAEWRWRSKEVKAKEAAEQAHMWARKAVAATAAAA